MAIVKPTPQYRVREYDGVFQIQRKQIKAITTGVLWWKKTTKEVEWKGVDKWGNCLWRSWSGKNDNYDQQIKPFKSLKDAYAKIDVMIKGETYHYRRLVNIELKCNTSSFRKGLDRIRKELNKIERA